MQEKTSSIKCFKYLGRGHITSQCPTKKTMIMRGQDIYSSQGEGQPLMVKEECKKVSVSSKRLIRQVCEVLIFICSLSQSTGLASHPLSAPFPWQSTRNNPEEG
ncbi:hypothetical protein GmHk_14G041323 [Glycine max]|nr:hypothetical protein GmHk_14G041323 [Glycine max]